MGDSQNKYAPLHCPQKVTALASHIFTFFFFFPRGLDHTAQVYFIFECFLCVQNLDKHSIYVYYLKRIFARHPPLLSHRKWATRAEKVACLWSASSWATEATADRRDLTAVPERSGQRPRWQLGFRRRRSHRSGWCCTLRVGTPTWWTRSTPSHCLAQQP